MNASTREAHQTSVQRQPMQQQQQKNLRIDLGRHLALGFGPSGHRVKIALEKGNNQLADDLANLLISQPCLNS